MYQWVSGLLRDRGLEAALVEESARFADELAGQEDPDNHYLKLRGGWTLSAQQQGVLRELVRWRELECQRRDRPRNRVLSDALLIAIAERLPGSLKELSNIQGIPSGAVRRYGDILIELVSRGSTADNSSLERIAPPLSRDQQGFFKQLIFQWNCWRPESVLRRFYSIPIWRNTNFSRVGGRRFLRRFALISRNY